MSELVVAISVVIVAVQVGRVHCDQARVELEWRQVLDRPDFPKIKYMSQLGHLMDLDSEGH